MDLKIISGCPIKNFVFRIVHDHIKNHKRMPSELKRALKNSQHVLTMVNRLTGQIKGVQDVQINRGRKKIGNKTLAGFCVDVCEVFIVGFENLATRKQESEIARYQREHAADETKDMELTLAGKPSGDFKDLDIVLPGGDQDTFTDDNIRELVKDGTLKTD